MTPTQALWVGVIVTIILLIVTVWAFSSSTIHHY